MVSWSAEEEKGCVRLLLITTSEFWIRVLGGFIRRMVCDSGEEGECESGAGCASPTHHKPIHTSISLPSGGGVRKEKEEMKEGIQMATELGTPGGNLALWVQGLVSLGHPSRSVSP